MHTRLPLEGHSMVLFVFSLVCLIAAVLVVTARCFVRLFMVGAFGLDDTLMLVGLFFFVGMTLCLIIGTMTGIGHHQVDFPPDMKYYSDALLLYYLAENFFIWSATFAKLSIATALLRLTVIQTHRIILMVVVGLIIAAGCLFGFVVLFSCTPVPYFWLRVLPTTTVTGKHCMPVETTLTVAYVYTVMSLFSDLTLGILPVFLVWRLQMNHRTKLAVGGILSLGSMASIGVIARLPFFSQYKDPDFLYALYAITICTTIESASAVIAGSLITLRPLFVWFLGKSTQRYDESPAYPLNGIKNNDSNIPTWRPDIEDNRNVVTTVIGPRKNRVFNLGQGESSEEHLNPVHVNIQETITVEETHE